MENQFRRESDLESRGSYNLKCLQQGRPRRKEVNPLQKPQGALDLEVPCMATGKEGKGRAENRIVARLIIQRY